MIFGDCVVCKKKEAANVLLEPCKHFCLCGTCLKKSKRDVCPICNNAIELGIIYMDGDIKDLFREEIERTARNRRDARALRPIRDNN